MAVQAYAGGGETVAPLLAAAGENIHDVWMRLSAIEYGDDIRFGLASDSQTGAAYRHYSMRLTGHFAGLGFCLDRPRPGACSSRAWSSRPASRSWRSAWGSTS